MKTKTAAREAGIHRDPPLLDRAKRLVNKMTARDRQALAHWMDDGMG
jgi:hypothetical protein